MERNALCWCGSGKKYKKCHMPIEEKRNSMQIGGKSCLAVSY